MSTQIIFWDVQHGHATYIKSPNNRHIVVDLGIGLFGEDSSEFSPLLHLKNSWNVNQLDYVVITHPHLDHLDDILNFDKLEPKVFSRPKHLSKENIMSDIRDEDKEKFEKYFEINERYNFPLGENNPNDPNNPENYGDLIIKNYTPRTCSEDNINNHSLIKVFSYAGIKVIIPGDNEKCSFEELLEDNDFVQTIRDSDILLAPHHGRKSGYNDDFINLVNPRLVVISDGRFCDTSATSRYSDNCRGWTVYKRSGGTEERKCLTTRKDGVISASFGFNSDNKPFLEVKID